ncbi:hypothetical protein [Streptomyces sp. NPDC051662]|uniref:hypothetical protein n=1 Tax=Streptomyces sp. NPDC051662 TaxID=3154750 RepID=UPI0034277F4C
MSSRTFATFTENGQPARTPELLAALTAGGAPGVDQALAGPAALRRRAGSGAWAGSATGEAAG